MIFQIDNSDDPRIAAYQNLKDKQLALDFGLFIVEGEFLVRRLLASSFRIHSILLTPLRFAADEWTTSPEVPIYIASKKIISKIVGFEFHRGVLALGFRPAPGRMWESADKNLDRLIICPEINDVENLGGIMRTAAGLGFEFVLLGESCCDPFARRAIRTSMGAAFKLKLFHSANIVQDLARLKSDLNFELHASVLDENAERLDKMNVPEKLGLLLGSEAHGLGPEILELADHIVTIPMKLGTDSLNVSVAAGILMYHYRKK